MRIAFDCDQCGTNYKVESDRAGQKAMCRTCGAELRVPVPPPPEDPRGTIVRHEERSKPFEPAFGDGDLIDAIVEHIERHVGEVTMVFHEIVSDLVHIDVHHIPPEPGRDFHTLITTGMSDKPMTVPDGAEDFQYAELVICLPPNWKLTQADFAQEQNYWPIRLIKSLARLPHEYDTWLGPGHSVPNGGEQPQPYADNTRFCCAIIVPAVRFGEDFLRLTTPDERIINFYTVWPILPDETEFKLKHGYDELLDRLLSHEVSDLIDIRRQSSVARRRWWPFGK
ncbi:MAG: suppressor of fused domain protein [Planctomycetaceae bacterium]